MYPGPGVAAVLRLHYQCVTSLMRVNKNEGPDGALIPLGPSVFSYSRVNSRS